LLSSILVAVVLAGFQAVPISGRLVGRAAGTSHLLALPKQEAKTSTKKGRWELKL
jgi:hypothetical protein